MNGDTGAPRLATVDGPAGSGEEEMEAWRHVLRHSSAHVMAQAVCALWPGTKYAIGPPVEDGFYYDFLLPGGARFSEEDLARIDAEMRTIVAADQRFVREDLGFADAAELFSDQPFKREIIEQVAARSGGGAAGAAAYDGGGDDAGVGSGAAGVPGRGAGGAPGGTVSIYRNAGAFVDLCLGPHVPSTGMLGAFRLLRVAGAYWRGDEKREQLQRVYGTAWESDEALAAYLERREEAERRDHRKLGAELDLFSFPGEIGAGLALFHPKGGLVRRLMEDYSAKRHQEGGYSFVYTPHLAKAELFETSGHLEWFAHGMYPAMELDEGTRYHVKPMNCPFHILIYASRLRSYRELPLRLFEFGTVYRYEKSGVVHGLTRVRGMTQDDSHIFCTRDQMRGELESLLTFVLDLLRDFGLEDFFLELSTKPEGKAVGTDEEWGEATEALRDAAVRMGLELKLDEGGGAFYGPKISVQARDAIGRHWQISTIQLDFQEPQRFGLEYVGADNARHRPVMIHRALFGTIERFLAILIEHYAGALPLWLSPVQVRVLPVRGEHEDYAGEVVGALAAAGLRADTEAAGEPLNPRIRRAKLEKLPYVLVVGAEDVSARTVGVNRRGAERPERGVGLDAFVEEALAEAERRG